MQKRVRNSKKQTNKPENTLLILITKVVPLSHGNQQWLQN